MDSIDAARRIVEHYTSNPPNIRQRTVFVQFSNHKELKTDSGPAQQVNQITIVYSLEGIDELKNISEFCWKKYQNWHLSIANFKITGEDSWVY